VKGTIVWYSPKKTQGIISVTENGIVQKFFLLQSRIVRSPEVIRAGQFARFVAVAPPPKPGLLPVALAVEISDTPFTTAGVNALASTVGAE
jgi:hypothetical protein